jgi:TrpR family trp operon transcriptional repressor
MNINDPRVAENLNELAATLAKTGDSKLIESFLRCLLTPAETADIAARWALVKALDQKIPQREIAKNLGLSLCKITRGSRELKKDDSAFRRVLDILEKTINVNESN